VARAGWLSDLMEGESAHREWVQEEEPGVWLAGEAMISERSFRRSSRPPSWEAVSAKRERIGPVWSRREIEVVREIGRIAVTVRQLPESPVVLDEPEDA
jgi:hypothetical protein